MAATPPPTYHVVLREAARIVEPLVRAVEGGPEALALLLDEIGVGEAALGATAYGALEARVQGLLGPWATVQVHALDPLGRGDPLDPARVPDVVAAVRSLFDAVRAFDTIPGTPPDVGGVGARALGALLVEWLEAYHRRAHAVLGVMGVVVEGDDGRETLDVGALTDLFSDPLGPARQAFGWGTETFDPTPALAHGRDLLWTLGLTPYLDVPPASDVEAFAGAAVDVGDGGPTAELVAPLLRLGLGAEAVFGFRVVPLPSVDGDGGGVALVPFGLAEARYELEVGGGWTFRATAAGEVDGHGLAVRPGAPPELRSLDGSPGPVSARLDVAVSRTEEASADGAVLGDPTGSHVALGSPALRARVEYDGAGAVVDVAVMGSGRLVVALGEADGFLRTVLPESGLEAAFDTLVGWSSRGGVYLDVDGALEVSIPSHIEVGPLRLDEVFLSAAPRLDARALDLTGAASGSVSLGPLTATASRLGVGLHVAAPEGGGDVGPFSFDVSFKPPNGVGLAVDAGVVVGGGYLFFDRERAEYAGVLQLEIGEIAVQAVGLLTTRMPDGSDGFSLLLLITAEFPPVQLGFGFTLNGLGGLVGVNRTVDVDVLREGLRARTLDAVMFPEDPVRNAPQIVSDLRRAFPPVPDQYVLGPMAVLGWGTPPVLRAELGVVLELPSPLRLVVMGQLAAAFPSFEVDPKLVDIKMDVLGVLDFGRKEASLDAALYDSRVSVYALEGEMAMRMRWGGSPSFALAVGGMHPRFQPPPGFPSLKRVSIALGKGDNPRLRLEGYLALTSNSVQVGARLDLYAKAGPASVRGELAFDALFEFDPFRFEVAIRARVTVRAFGASVGVGLRLALSGPTPWRAKGRVTIEICWVDVSVGFDVTLGPGKQPALPPPADVWTVLAGALADARSWSAELPERGGRLATLREGPAGGDLAVHPLGTLAVRQRAVPLDTVLETFGGAPVEGARRFTVASVRLGKPGSADFDDLGDNQALDGYFAPAQFFELADEEKVSAPAFEALPAGVGGIGASGGAGSGSGLTTAWATNVGPHPHTEKTYRLVTEVVDRDRPAPPPVGARRPDYVQGAAGFEAAAAFGAAAQSALRRTGRARFAAAPLGLGLRDTAYAVADARTLRRVDADALPAGSVLRDRLARQSARTYAGARAALRAHLRAAPGDRDRYTVLAEHELNP